MTPPHSTSEIDPATLQHLCTQSTSDLYHVACATGDLPQIRILQEYWQSSATHASPGLRVAIEHEQLAALSYLLDNGVHVDPGSASAALRTGSIPLLETLIAHGWDINQRGRGLPVLNVFLKPLEVRNWLLDRGADPNVPNTAGYNALDLAAGCEPISVLRQLLDYGGDPSRSSALQSAIQSLQSNHDEKLQKVTLLLDHGALIDARDREWCPELRTKYGSVGRALGTPLHCAVAAADDSLVETLLSRGADPTVEDWNGRLPIALTTSHEGRAWERIRSMLGITPE